MYAVEILRAHALVGIPVGLLAGLLLGLVARRADGWGGYDSERRRAARLGHVALVMLPALSGLYGLWLGGAPRPFLVAIGAWLWVPGSVALALALGVLAARPRLKALLPLPALVVSAGAVVFALAGLLP